jgi:hypothetical protein
VNETMYLKWFRNDEIVFSDPEAGNYSAMLMDMNIPDVTSIM